MKIFVFNFGETRSKVGEIETVGNRSRERSVWPEWNWKGYIVRRLRHESVNRDLWTLRSGPWSHHPCSQMSQLNTGRGSNIPQILWLRDDESGIQKQEVWNKMMFTIENAFVICVQHYIIFIFDITFPHDNTLIQAPCCSQENYISCLCLKLPLNLEQSGYFIPLFLPSILPAPWDGGSCTCDSNSSKLFPRVINSEPCF